jgi:hypothetical protein
VRNEKGQVIMFDFLRRSGQKSTAAAIQRALAASKLPAGMDPATLSVVESRGRYAGRNVTHFRVFDARQVDGRVGSNGKRVRYQDLDAHRALVLRSGYIEEDGTVMLMPAATDDAVTRQASETGAAVPPRAAADRAAHPDDAHFFAREGGS